MKRTEKPGSVPNRQTFSFLHKEISTHSQITNLFKKHFLFLPPPCNLMEIISQYKKYLRNLLNFHWESYILCIIYIYYSIIRADICFRISKYRKTIGPPLYSNAGKTSVQSSELDAKSDTNEIKLMVTDHAEGNRILSALYIIVPLQLTITIPTELQGNKNCFILFWLDGGCRSISIMGFLCRYWSV